MRHLLIASLLAAAAAGPVFAQEPTLSTETREASIPFVNHGGIRDWQENGDDSLYIQDQHRQWYIATLMGTCTGLRFATVIGIETRGTDTLDRFGTIMVRGDRCALTSLVKSDPPARKAKGQRTIAPPSATEAETKAE